MRRCRRTSWSLTALVVLLLSALFAADCATAQAVPDKDRVAVTRQAKTQAQTQAERCGDAASDLTLTGVGGHEDEHEHKPRRATQVAVTLPAPASQPACDCGCGVRTAVTRQPTSPVAAREAVPRRRSIELPLLHQAFRC
jgi:hypothetical protein